MSLVSSMLAAKRHRLFHYLLSAPVFHQCQVIMAILAAVKRDQDCRATDLACCALQRQYSVSSCSSRPESDRDYSAWPACAGQHAVHL